MLRNVKEKIAKYFKFSKMIKFYIVYNKHKIVSETGKK